MANKRMYSKDITDSDDFIEMSSAAQALYFHLNQGADDDGFNNQIQLAMLKAHASTDDLKILMAKSFVIRFDCGVIVIKHWRMHNTLRKDRYTPTNYQEEFKLLGIKENGSYTLGCQVVAEGLPDGCHSKEKKRTEENSKKDMGVVDAVESQSGDELEADFDRFWRLYPRKVNKDGARKAFRKVKEPVEVLLKALENHKKSSQWLKDNGVYIPHPTTWLNQRRWEDVLPEDKSIPKGASGQLGEAELEAIRRVLKEEG